MKKINLVLALLILLSTILLSDNASAAGCKYGYGRRYVPDGPVVIGGPGVGKKQKFKIYEGCKSQNGIVRISDYTYVGWTYRYVYL